MQTLESRIKKLIAPLGDVQMRVIAYEMTHDGEGWSVNTPFCIGKGDADEVAYLARCRWNVFRANYAPKATVGSLANVGWDDDASEIEANGLPFLRVEVCD